MVPALVVGPTKAPIGCHKRLYTYRVTREILSFNQQFSRCNIFSSTESDAKGNSCYDTISITACWGRCDSKEASDWKFPFKKSHHPVCMHSGRVRTSVMLRNCDPDAGLEARKYDYMEPVGCSCQTCSSADTWCESPQQLQKGHKANNDINKFITSDILADY